MSFPVVIEGQGTIVGTIKLLGFADERQATLSDAIFESEQITLERREVEHFAFVMRQLREVVGVSFLKRSKNLIIAVTDGGYLAYTEGREERAAVPYQLLREGALPISERARRLVLEDAMINVVYTFLGTRYCSGLQRYIDRFANPLYPLWYSRQQMITILAGLHRFLHLEVEDQILLRDAYEHIELGDGGRQPYAQMLRRLQHSRLTEIPRSMVGQVIGLVSMTPDLFPVFTDKQLLDAIAEKFVDAKGEITASEEEIFEWMLDTQRTSRDLSEVLWKEHNETALAIERAIAGINLRHNRPSDVLRKISEQAPLHALAPLFLAGQPGQLLDDLCAPLEEFCKELQANLHFGIENLRTYMQLVFNWIAELQGIGRYPGDRVEFLHGLADRLKANGCRSATNAASAYADAIDEEQNFRARQRAAEERAATVARESSARARARFSERLATAGTSLPELSTVTRESLVMESDLLVEDVRGAINDMLRHFYGQEEIADKLIGQMELLVLDPRASPSFRECMQKRYSLTHDRQISYEGLDSTDLCEIFVALLVFEEQVPDLEDAEGKLQIRRRASEALNKERGALKGELFSKKTGWVEDVSTGELGRKLANAIEDLRARVEAGKSKFAPELADINFRIALFAALRDDFDVALTHFRDVIRATLDDELIEHMDGGKLTRKIDLATFKKSNKFFASREEAIRRAKAAGVYLELFIRRAQRALDGGNRPEIEPDMLDKIMDLLEMERVLGDRPPIFKVLRHLPRIVTLGKQEFRVRDFLPAGAGGQAGQMALLQHVFAGEPFARFMGYKIIETESDDHKSVNRFITKVGINNYIRDEYLKVFPRLFPNFEAEMTRQRYSLQNQIFTRKLVDELVTHFGRKSRDDALHLRRFDARVTEIVDRHRRFPLLLLEFIPGLSDSLPKTIYGLQTDSSGLLTVRPKALVAEEVASAETRMQIAARITREQGISMHKHWEVMLDQQLTRLRAHSAALAVLLMNVDHQIFTVEGRLVALDYEILMAPCFDPDWEKEIAPGEPVSTYFTKRINVSWVSDREDAQVFADVGELYRGFIREKADKLMDWALDAGFLLTDAGAVKDLLLRNSNRLPEDLQTLVASGGTVYLTANHRDADGSVEYGAVVPRNELRTRTSGGLAALLAGKGATPPIAATRPQGSLSEMTLRLSAMQETLAISKQSGDDEATMNLS